MPTAEAMAALAETVQGFAHRVDVFENVVSGMMATHDERIKAAHLEQLKNQGGNGVGPAGDGAPPGGDAEPQAG